MSYNAEKVLLEVQESLTGMSKLGYESKDIIKWANDNIENNLINIIIDDIEGMDVDEIKKYLRSSIKN